MKTQTAKENHFREAAMNRLSSHSLFQKTAIYKTLAEAPLGFLDIGARGGAHPLVAPVASLTAVLGFEPDEDSCKAMLADKALKKNWARFDLEPIALVDKAGKAELHLLAAPTNHSLRAPNTDFTHRYHMPKWEEVGRAPLITERLDAILFGKRAREEHWGEFIKIDTQGTEFEIFEGAARTLSERTVAIMSEVAFCELYKGQKLFSDVERLLRGYGFTFYGFHTFHTRSQGLLDKRIERGAERAMYADAVFFKDPLPGAAYGKKLSTRQHRLLALCALLTGYFDFALELMPGDEALRALVAELAYSDPREAEAEAAALCERIRQSPEQANLLVGKFVDAHRQYFDYDDVIL